MVPNGDGVCVCFLKRPERLNETKLIYLAVQRGTIMLANAVKLVNTAHASISEHKRASLQNPFSAAVSLRRSSLRQYLYFCTQ